MEETTQAGRTLSTGSNVEMNYNIRTKKNPQLILLKMILREDGRLVKYICLFAVFGVVLAPVNFMFSMMHEICEKRDYNFSQLTGAVIISLATTETLSFLMVPVVLNYLSRSKAIGITFLLMASRALFYAGWYFDGQVSVVQINASGGPPE